MIDSKFCRHEEHRAGVTAAPSPRAQLLQRFVDKDTVGRTSISPAPPWGSPQTDTNKSWGSGFGVAAARPAGGGSTMRSKGKVLR